MSLKYLKIDLNIWCLEYFIYDSTYFEMRSYNRNIGNMKFVNKMNCGSDNSCVIVSMALLDGYCITCILEKINLKYTMTFIVLNLELSLNLKIIGCQ